MSTQVNNSNTGTPRGARMAFGIFMVIIYVTMGVLCICNVFNNILTVRWIAITLGIILVIYGLWRGFRLARGMN